VTRYRATTVAPTVAAALARHDGRVVDSPEVLRDYLYPELEPVVWPMTALVQVPARSRPLTCPDCGGGHVAGHPDPLELAHRSGCLIGEEEQELATADLHRLARGIRRGRDHFHRHCAPVELDLLTEVGLEPLTLWTGVHVVGLGRRRTWATLSRFEPALTTATDEERRER